MNKITEIANQFADGLITSLEFRNHLILQLMKIESEDELFLLCTLLLRTEPTQ